MDKVSASQHQDRGVEPHTGHDHGSSYDTRVIQISFENLLHNRAKISEFKLHYIDRQEGPLHIINKQKCRAGAPGLWSF